MSFGKPNYGENKGFKKKNNFNTSGGDVIAQILPPWGLLKDKGVWNVFHSVHFGYKNTEGKFRPFESCLEEKYDKETKARTVIVPDAAYDRFKDLQAQLAKAKLEKNAAAQNVLEQLVGFGGTYNVDNNMHMNVLLLDGKAGELKIRYKMFLALKSEIDRLRKEGDEASNFQPVDPLSLEEGRFFVFHKEGKGNETSFKVTVYQETIDVPNFGKVKRPYVSRVSPDVIARLDAEMFHLDNLFPQLTSEEVARIVDTSDLRTGKSPAIDEYIDNRRKAKQTASAGSVVPATQPAPTVTPNSITAPTGITTVTAVPLTVTAAEPTTVTTVTPAMALAAYKETSTVTTVQPSKPVQAADEMSDEDFFKQLEAR